MSEQSKDAGFQKFLLEYDYWMENRKALKEAYDRGTVDTLARYERLERAERNVNEYFKPTAERALSGRTIPVGGGSWFNNYMELYQSIEALDALAAKPNDTFSPETPIVPTE